MIKLDTYLFWTSTVDESRFSAICRTCFWCWGWTVNQCNTSFKIIPLYSISSFGSHFVFSNCKLVLHFFCWVIVKFIYLFFQFISWWKWFCELNFQCKLKTVYIVAPRPKHFFFKTTRKLTSLATWIHNYYFISCNTGKKPYFNSIRIFKINDCVVIDFLFNNNYKS